MSIRTLTTLRAMSNGRRCYADAIDALNSLQTPYHIIEARRKAGIRPDASSQREMEGYLRRIGYTPAKLTQLNVVHVAGTKGKGSTCAFVDSIFRHHNLKSRKPLKTGLFISPHLIAVRERIRIDSAPLAEALFAKYFFDVWDRLEANTAQGEGGEGKPAYARYLTLMSWHAFMQEGVDAAIYETGIGGEFDATNLVEQPLVSGITTLGIDHVFALGETIGKIAWHKAGIMKTGAPAFTVPQLAEAQVVLEDRAREKQVDLKIRGIDPRLQDVKITPDADFQKKNASLAVALAETALLELGALDEPLDAKNLPQTFRDGLEKTVFRGRCEIKTEENVTWHIDGAHTLDSLKESSKWFMSASTSSRPRILIFNQQGRTEATTFLEPIWSTVQPTFDLVIFCSNVTYALSGYKKDFVNHQYDKEEVDGLVQQKRFQEAWQVLQKGADIRVLRTIEEALVLAREVGKERGGVDVFATGSLHLVGGVLGMLEKADAL